MALAARAATGGADSRAGARHAHAVRPGPHAHHAAAGIAPATGLALPSLQGVEGWIRVSGNLQDEIRCARAMTLAGVANPEHWARAKRRPHKYLQRTLEAWIDEGYGDLPRVTALDAALVHGLGELYGGDAAEDPDVFHVIVAADSFVPVYLDATMRVLEAADPRFPITFHELLLQAMRSVGDAYNWHDALDGEWSTQLLVHLSRPEEAEDGEMDGSWQDSEAIEMVSESWKDLEERAKAVLPAYLLRRPYSVRELRNRLCRITQPAALRLFTDVLAILNESRLMESDMGESFESLSDSLDWTTPWPTFFLGFREGDQLAGVWDQECVDRDNAGFDALPCLVFRFNVTDPDSIRRARDLIGRACRILGMIKKLLDSLPLTPDPGALANILVHV